jgi:hypothetical protein
LIEFIHQGMVTQLVEAFHPAFAAGLTKSRT